MAPLEWPHIRSIARCVFPVLVGPRTALMAGAVIAPLHVASLRTRRKLYARIVADSARTVANPEIGGGVIKSQLRMQWQKARSPDKRRAFE